jgi:uncharacterized protein DUF2690
VRRHLVGWIATACLAAAFGLVGTASPALAATCYEATCDGKALTDTDCATNKLIWDDLTVTGALAIQLMYSPGCHAFWGEMQIINGGGASAGLFAVPQYGSGTLETILESGASFGSGLETHLWNAAGHSVKFCWGQNSATDPGDAPTAIAGCTGWR